MQKSGAKNKRGISPLIATVLIVAFVVVVGGLVTLFLTKQVKTALEKQPDCGPSQILNTEMGLRCVSTADGNCEVTFINNGRENIDLTRVVINHENGEPPAESPAPSFINLKPGAEFTVKYKTKDDQGCDSVSGFPGIVVESERGARATLCTDLETSATCSA